MSKVNVCNANTKTKAKAKANANTNDIRVMTKPRLPVPKQPRIKPGEQNY